MTIEQAAELKNLIKSLAGGTIFSVVFIKRTTGERREMVCRLGTSKGVKMSEGAGPAYNALEKGLLTVYDMQKDAWRSIPLDAIESIKIRGKVYKGSIDPRDGSGVHPDPVKEDHDAFIEPKGEAKSQGLCPNCGRPAASPSSNLCGLALMGRDCANIQ